MTTSQELKDRYTGLYDYMAQSRDPKNMKAFGCVMTEMMDYLITNKPDVAEEMIDQLEAIKWKQYLTPKEAEKIVAGMDPAGPWKRDAWKNAMEGFGLPLEEQPYYNRCALWVEMNKTSGSIFSGRDGLFRRCRCPHAQETLGGYLRAHDR